MRPLLDWLRGRGLVGVNRIAAYIRGLLVSLPATFPGTVIGLVLALPQKPSGAYRTLPEGRASSTRADRRIDSPGVG